MTALTDLADSAPTGLSEDEARERARQGQANTPVSGSTRTTARILRTTVFSFYNNVLFVIGIALVALGRYSDALVSVGLGLINALLSAFQELRARRTLNRLQLLAREPVTVVRDGVDRQVLPADVVRGDLLRVRSGNQIVVDGPVVAVSGSGDRPGLEVDESLLTGEADPIPKAVGDQLLSGSSCASGEGLQRAEAVGTASHAGRLTLAARADTTSQTPLQWRIELVVRLLITLVVLMSGAILAQAALDGSTVLRFVQTSAVLSGLVPYGLFFLIAVAYTVGAARIAGRGALVQQVNAVEAVSRIDVVCTDKTGTLTSGRLTLAELVTPEGGDLEQVRRLLGTFARSASAPNATTAALAADESLPGERAEIVDEVEFRSALRWSGVVFGPDAAVSDVAVPDGTGRGDAAGRAVVLGAPATLRPALVDPAPALDDLDRQARGFADRGLRVLLLATSTPGRDGARAARGDRLRGDEDRPQLPPLQAVALVAMADELREGVSDVLAGLTAERVAVKVISGDDPTTVAALARRAGLHGSAISGPALAELAPADDADPAGNGPVPGVSTEAFDEAVDSHTVFGRIAPDQKEQIVASLRRRGHQVAMVGDGVNDARALKRAQVGVAMRSGSSVTRDVADIVLLDNSFTTLPPARTEGRRIVSGVGSSMYLFLARVTVQMLVILTVTLLGLGFPYTPTQVGLTLFTVGIPTFFLTLWARPEPPRDDLLVSLARFVIPVGVITAGFATAVYAVLYRLVYGLLSGPAVDPALIAGWERYTGLTYGVNADFVGAAAALGGQSGLSVFVSTSAILLILLLEPPARIFTAWTRVVDDRRPTWLALGLFLAFVVVLVVPATRSYFGLTAPDPPVIFAAAPAVVLWFVTLSLVLRFRVLERTLGLLPSTTAGTTGEPTPPAAREATPRPEPEPTPAP